jgi:predicted Na+-dependent transporter
MAALTPFLCLLLSGYASLSLDILSSSVTIELVILLIIPTYAKVSSNNITQLHHESIYRYLLKDKANGGLLYQHLKLTPFLCLLLSGYASLNLDILSSSVTIAPLWVLPINGGLLYQHLKHQGRSYRKCYGYAHNHTGIPNRVDKVIE